MDTTQITALARARKATEAAKKALDDFMKPVTDGDPYKTLEAALDAAKVSEQATYDAVASEAETEYGIAKEKNPDEANRHPADGLEIKEVDVVTILDKPAAKEWCMTHFTPALSLDEKAFEKAAKDGNVPENLATVKKVPKAYIAKDLSKWLEEQ
jgi:hypothetical protein